MFLVLYVDEILIIRNDIPVLQYSNFGYLRISP